MIDKVETASSPDTVIQRLRELAVDFKRRAGCRGVFVITGKKTCLESGLRYEDACTWCLLGEAATHMREAAVLLEESRQRKEKHEAATLRAVSEADDDDISGPSALRPVPCPACGRPTYEDKRHQRDTARPPYCALCGNGQAMTDPPISDSAASTSVPPERETVPTERRYRFFVDDRAYVTEHQFLNSMEIKSHAGVPLGSRLAPELIRRQLDAGQTIFLSDDERIDLAGDPKHFYSVPQAY